MRHLQRSNHLALCLLSLSTAALVFLVAFSRYYVHLESEESALSDSESSYQVYQLSEGLSATPPSPLFPYHVGSSVVSNVYMHQPVVRVVVVVRLASPRAPPLHA